MATTPEMMSPEMVFAWPAVHRVVTHAPPEARVSVAIRDLGGDGVYAHNQRDPFPAASTVKLLILVAVAREVAAGRVALDTAVPLPAGTRVGGSGVLNWLPSVTRLSVQDLAWLMTAISDNTASNALLDLVGFPAVERVVADLALERTALVRHFMRPQPGRENTTSANDLVTLLTAIYRALCAPRAQCDWMLTVLADQQVRDRLARYLPEDVTFAGKSGWQSGISHDAGIVRRNDRAVAIAVLTEGFTDPHAATAFIGAIGQAVTGDLGIA